MSPSTPFVCANGMVPMPDGARLATLVVRPKGDTPVPAVLLRTPYSKDRHLEEGLGWARRGFAFVAQDVRGRYDSDDVWEPYVAEHADGAATVAWLAAQPWADGVVVVGGSYAGFAAWAAAVSNHPAVRAAIVLVPAMGSHHTMYDPAGILNLGDHTWWWMTYADGRTERSGLFEAMHRAEPELLAHLPVTDIAKRLWADLPGWRERQLAGPDARPAYAIGDDALAQLTIPTLHIGGWHDPFVEHTLRQWEHAGSAATPRPERALVVGPWTHTTAFNGTTVVGERDFGSHSRLALGKLQVTWLHRVLGSPVVQATSPSATIFMMGSNQWQQHDTWPPSTQPQHWYAANGGRLTIMPAEHAGSDSFHSDPRDPFPSRSLPVDQRDLAARTDAVRYVTPPLSAPVMWIGSPTVTLFAATDAPATDWVVRLHELFADGRMLYLTHGLVDAARACNGNQPGRGTFARYQITLKPQAVTIPLGHRLCVEIASAAFPEYARNLQTGADRYTTTDTCVALQQIGFGSPTPTCLTLPTTTSASHS